jgi:capsular exopolysaccharide synthesis family protein
LPLVGALPAVPVASVKLDAGEDPNAYRLAEAIRSLRATLLLTTLGGATGRVLAVTSSAPREGKSSVSAHLAISLARTGKRVLLIDADMHRPTLHLVLGETVERGLSHRLMGEAGVQPMPSRHGLDFLGVGTLPPRPGELLHTPYLADLLADARARYDFTIIDTPPLGAVSDALVLAGAIDGLLVVVRDGVTNKGLLKEALARLAPCAAKVMGVVLNAELYRRPGYDAYGYSGAGNRAAAS